MPRNSRKSKIVAPSIKIKKVNSLQWIFEPLESNPEFCQKRMFGCEAGYIGDRLVLVLADGDEPWNGVLVPTERECHPRIQEDFPQLKPHLVLGKWLYYSQINCDFEKIVDGLIKRIHIQDPRFGIDPKPRKSKKKRPPAGCS